MLGGGRQLDHEPRASELRVLEPDFPSDFGHHALADREAEARTLVGALGGEEGIEDSELGGARFVVELPAAPEKVETRSIG